MTRDVAVDPAGRVHLAWSTDGALPLPVWRSRSLDGGQTFETAVNGGSADISVPRSIDLVSARDGSLLTAIYDADQNDSVRVVVTRSTDGGLVHDRIYNDSASALTEGAVRLVLSSGSPTVLLLLIELDRCSIYRSQNHGASFSFTANLSDVQAPSLDGRPSAVETSAGHWALARTADSDAPCWFKCRPATIAWETVGRADDATDDGTRVAGTIAAVTPDDFFVPWTDRRGASRTTADIRGNASAVIPLGRGGLAG